MFYFFYLRHFHFPQGSLDAFTVRFRIPVRGIVVKVKDPIPGRLHIFLLWLRILRIEIIPVRFIVCHILASQNIMPHIKVRQQEAPRLGFKGDLYQRCASFGIAGKALVHSLPLAFPLIPSPYRILYPLGWRADPVAHLICQPVISKPQVITAEEEAFICFQYARSFKFPVCLFILDCP